eukprot:g349.t1
MPKPPSAARRRAKPRGRARPAPAAPVEAVVERLGAQGDGVAETGAAGRLYIPYAAPGDRLIATPGPRRGDGRAAQIAEILSPSPERIDPVCRHFGRCGGCALQHVRADAIAREKRALLVDALARKGFAAPPVAETVSIPPGDRRRARFAVRRRAGGAVLGFNERAGAAVVDLQECPVLRPDLAAVLPALRALCGRLDSLGRAADLQVLASETGLDLLFAPDRPAEPGLAEREALTAFADARDAARIAWIPAPDAPPEPVVARRAPRVVFGGVALDPPPGAFLQPGRAGEAAIGAAVAAALEAHAPAADRIADLYAGCGALGLPLAARGLAVHAVEGLADHIAAFRKAGGAQGLRVSAEVRDLARAPLEPEELARFDAVLFDPPRAGAAEQARMLAGSAVPLVIAVSCNPSTLARDLRLLADGGYRLVDAQPIDQFPWSGHLEAVAAMVR